MASVSVIVSARKFSYVAGLLIVIGIFGVTAYRSVTRAPEAEFASTTITLNERQFQVDIADTNGKQAKGLGGRDGLAEDEGMLFIFDKPGEYCFWMKDVDFEIDIIWFNSSQEFVELKSPATPESYPELFCPKEDIAYVLELNGGTVESMNLKEGDRFTAPNL